MKKFLSIIILGFLFIGNSYAEEKITINSLLKQGYKIVNKELTKYQNGDPAKIISLKKKNDYFVCTFIVSPFYKKETNCIKP